MRVGCSQLLAIGWCCAAEWKEKKLNDWGCAEILGREGKLRAAVAVLLVVWVAALETVYCFGLVPGLFAFLWPHVRGECFVF